MTNWQTKTIGDLVNYEQPSKYLVKSTNYITKGTPVLTANKAFILGHTDETDGLYRASEDSPVVIFDDFTTDSKFVDFDFKVKSSAIKILTTKSNEALPKFVHGAMQLIKTDITEHKRRFISEYRFNPVDVPELPEQERIVRVLEVWDEYIVKLEQKIALKEQLKKGLMQQLLTGKRRLPGFSDRWQVITLGEIANVSMGQSPSSSAYNESGEGVILIQGNADMKNGKTIARIWTTEVTKKAPRGSLIMTVRAPVGEIAVSTEDVCLGRGVCSIESDYLHYLRIYLSWFKPMWAQFIQGSTFESINGSDIRNLSINIPSLKEANKIVNTIGSAEDSIATLKALRDCIYSQKKYLLKNLITGTIRTPENLKHFEVQS